MTIERSRPTLSRAPGRGDLMAYLLALLATGYVTAWWLLGAPASRGSVERPLASRARTRDPAPTVWLDDLPSAALPALVTPPGWHVVDRAAPFRRAPEPVDVPPARSGRVRTRSS